MPKNLMQAHRQWATRPDDERFLTLEALHAATLDRADRSSAEILHHDRFQLHGEEIHDGRMVIELPGRERPLGLTNWTFGQLCQRSKVGTRFATSGCLPHIVATAMNYNLRHVVPKEASNVFTTRLDEDEIELRAVTGPSYGRIYDHNVVQSVIALNEAQDGRWVIPAGSTMTAEEAAKSLRATTLYASDRDVFIFLVDPSTPIEVKNPTGPDAVLYRGFMVWNTEVGGKSLGIRTFFFNHTCDNRIVWGAQDVRTMRIRHTSGGPERFRREAMPMLQRYADASLGQSAASIKAAMDYEVGNTDIGVEDWLKSQRFTKSEAQKLIQKAKEEEGKARSIWDLVQGGTAMARAIPHTDRRVDAEAKVSRLLSRAEAKIN
jgi:hypothetical protein